MASRLDLRPLDLSTNILQSGIIQGRALGRGIESLGKGISLGIEGDKLEKKERSAEFLDSLNIELEDFTYEAFTLEQAKLIDGYVDKYSKLWTERKGKFTTQDKVRMLADQKMVENQQNQLLGKQKAVEIALEVLKSDQKGLYDREKFAEYYGNLLSSGDIVMNTSTGIPMLEYADVDAKSWLGSQVTDYQTEKQKVKGASTYLTVGEDKMTNVITQPFGDEEDVRSFLAARLLQSPNVMSSVRKEMDADKNFTPWSNTPTIDYLQYKYGFEKFTTPDVSVGQRRTPGTGGSVKDQLSYSAQQDINAAGGLSGNGLVFKGQGKIKVPTMYAQTVKGEEIDTEDKNIEFTPTYYVDGTLQGEALVEVLVPVENQEYRSTPKAQQRIKMHKASFEDLDEDMRSNIRGYLGKSKRWFRNNFNKDVYDNLPEPEKPDVPEYYRKEVKPTTVNFDVSKIMPQLKNRFEYIEQDIGGIPHQKEAAPSYSKEYLIGLGYSEKQINDAVNSGKIRLE